MNSEKKYVILHVITGLSTGGAETMLYRLLAQTNRVRFEPVVISLIDKGNMLGDRIEALDIPVYTIGMRAGVPTFKAFQELARLVRQIKPQLIQGWMYHGNLAASLASWFYFSKKFVFWSIHHSINSLKSEKSSTIKIIKLGAYLSRLTAKIAFVSQASKTQHELLGYDQSRCLVIPNGFDTSIFSPSYEARLSVREELKIAPTSILIGLVCRYHPMKDHANFIQAAGLLLEKQPDVHFLLAGTGVSQTNQDLLDIIENGNISNNIHLLGERRDTPRLIASLDIMSLSSAYGEAFPLVVGEAMSCGVPCVVTDVGDSAWVVSDTGRVVPPKDSAALAKAWKDLIGLGLDRRILLGTDARNRILDLFSLESVVRQYEAMYESVLDKK
ncbi:MAG: glycoside hydrolase [Pseudanabaena sp.]|nr:MAG: glycoside hydrolase [Pseudanabaena sp.]